MINILSGELKNSNLIFPKKFYFNKFFKPTPSYVKKKVFSWLGCLENLTCLDMFSGSGSLGFEAASNRCKRSVMLEKNSSIFFYLKKNKLRLNIFNCSIYNYNCFYYIKNINKIFYDIVFIDCPYILLKKLIKSIDLCLNFLKKNSLIYIETIFNINLIINFFEKKINCIKNDFFNKINFFLFKVL